MLSCLWGCTLKGIVFTTRMRLLVLSSISITVVMDPPNFESILRNSCTVILDSFSEDCEYAMRMMHELGERRQPHACEDCPFLLSGSSVQLAFGQERYHSLVVPRFVLLKDAEIIQEQSHSVDSSNAAIITIITFSNILPNMGFLLNLRKEIPVSIMIPEIPAHHRCFH